jgi:hypothetical protein
MPREGVGKNNFSFRIIQPPAERERVRAVFPKFNFGLFGAFRRTSTS